MQGVHIDSAGENWNSYSKHHMPCIFHMMARWYEALGNRQRPIIA